MKRNKKLFFKSFLITSIILICMGMGFFGMAKAYEGIRLIGFGEDRNAVTVGDGVLYFFDSKINLPRF